MQMITTHLSLPIEVEVAVRFREESFFLSRQSLGSSPINIHHQNDCSSNTTLSSIASGLPVCMHAAVHHLASTSDGL